MTDLEMLAPYADRASALSKLTVGATVQPWSGEHMALMQLLMLADVLRMTGIPVGASSIDPRAPKSG